MIRQFYTEPRKFRITGKNGKEEFATYQNTNIQPTAQSAVMGQDTGFRRPIFDIEIRAQKASPFSTVALNELAKEMYGAQFFNPQMADQALMALDMMSFEGKNAIESKIAENSTLVQTLIQLATIVDALQGSTIAPQLAQQYGVQAPQASMGGGVQTNALGAAVQSAGRNTATTARDKATNVANPG